MGGRRGEIGDFFFFLEIGAEERWGCVISFLLRVCGVACVRGGIHLIWREKGVPMQKSGANFFLLLFRNHEMDELFSHDVHFNAKCKVLSMVPKKKPPPPPP